MQQRTLTNSQRIVQDLILSLSRAIENSVGPLHNENQTRTILAAILQDHADLISETPKPKTIGFTSKDFQL